MVSGMLQAEVTNVVVSGVMVDVMNDKPLWNRPVMLLPHMPMEGYSRLVRSLVPVVVVLTSSGEP